MISVQAAEGFSNGVFERMAQSGKFPDLDCWRTRKFNSPGIVSVEPGYSSFPKKGIIANNPQLIICISSTGSPE